MAKRTCPKCGGPIYSYDPECRQCGYSIQEIDKELHKTQQNASYFEGDNEAENILRDTLNWIKNILIIASIIFGTIWMIMGLVEGTQTNNFIVPFITIIGGVLVIFIGYAIAKLIWAIGMIFINISTNVRIIKKELLSK